MTVKKEPWELEKQLEGTMEQIELMITLYLDEYADYGWDSFTETLTNVSAQLYMMKVMIANADVKHEYMNR